MARLRHIMITNGGTGYSSPPTLAFNGIGGQTVAPVATATVFGGSITEITITNAGAFSTGPTSITLSGGGGTGGAVVPFSEETRPSWMMTLTLDDDIFNWNEPIRLWAYQMNGHREFDPWRSALPTLELGVTATPRRDQETIIPGISR